MTETRHKLEHDRRSAPSLLKKETLSTMLGQLSMRFMVGALLDEKRLEKRRRLREA